MVACTTVPSQQTDRAGRLALHDLKTGQLEVQDDWSLSGKLAVSNERDGGSGNLAWRQRADYTRMDFHGAFGRGAWRLEADGNGARLELADGSTYQENTVDELVQQQVGWKIPVENLSWWVRGMAAPGATQGMDFDERGNLVRLDQDGWIIEFGSYRTVAEFEMPVRMTAQKADWKVKLAVRRWELSRDGASDG
jgi:outer membrane lipoprotein LolB